MPPKVKPKLRGVFHQFGFIAALGGALVLAVAPVEGAQHTAGVVYALTLCLMLGLSTLYHRPTWSMRMRQRLRLVDHAGIFTLIAGTVTPLAVRAAHGQWTQSLTVMWAASMAGMAFVVFYSSAHRFLRAAVYVGIGLLALPVILSLRTVMAPSLVALVLVGAAIYIVGAVVYARRWPNPQPAVFGYHEVFHVLVLVAAAAHFAVVVTVQYRFET
ncbi:MAG: hemolysin III family protein [Archangium sp.]|nr:hemolysin III family protein [Archangium sp.]